MDERQLRGCIHACKLPAVIEAGLAAGHPATTAAGIEILADGGSAADAAVAAALASCVAETVMTGLLGGGHAIYFDAATRRARNLDCFVAVPGLGAEPREAELVHLEVPFGAELVHYAVGPALDERPPPPQFRFRATTHVAANLSAFGCAVGASLLLGHLVPAALSAVALLCWLVLARRTFRARRGLSGRSAGR